MFKRGNKTGELCRPPETWRPVLPEGRGGCIFGPTTTQPAGSRWGTVMEGMPSGISKLYGDVRSGSSVF